MIITYPRITFHLLFRHGTILPANLQLWLLMYVWLGMIR